MNEEKNYRLAVAFLQFKTAYKNLVAASKELPELNVSECYPFYLLDFEEIEPAVLQWCTIHATQLMKNLPDKVDNPACAHCAYLRAGLGPDGQCKGMTATWCGVYPYISFTKELALPVLIAANMHVADLSDNDVHLLYMKRMDEIYAQKKTTPDDTRPDDTRPDDTRPVLPAGSSGSTINFKRETPPTGEPTR
jgi:hypothetical protein